MKTKFYFSLPIQLFSSEEKYTVSEFFVKVLKDLNLESKILNVWLNHRLLHFYFSELLPILNQKNDITENSWDRFVPFGEYKNEWGLKLIVLFIFILFSQKMKNYD